MARLGGDIGVEQLEEGVLGLKGNDHVGTESLAAWSGAQGDIVSPAWKERRKSDRRAIVNLSFEAVRLVVGSSCFFEEVLLD